MKILFINSDYGSGSTGRIVRDLKRELEKQNNTCIALYGRENNCSEANVYRIGDKLSVYYHVFMTRLADRQGFSSSKATRECLKILKEFQPDIIHLHNLHGSYLDCKILFDYLKTAGIPVLWTLHDCWPFTGHCSHYSFAECDKWQIGCSDCVQTAQYPKSLVDRSVANYKKKKECFQNCPKLHITTVSEWLKREVEKSFLQEYPVTVVPNGVDLSVFAPSDSEALKNEFGFTGKKVLISVASVWGKRKGLELLLQLAERLDNTYCLVLVGVNQKPGNLPQNVRIVRRTDSIQELAALYCAADVYINASVEETFGMVSLEALACGKPVITNSFTANPELIDDTCGVIVSDYSVEGYLSAIQSNSLWALRAEDCRRRAESFSHQAMIEKYITLYRSML